MGKPGNEAIFNVESGANVHKVRTSPSKYMLVTMSITLLCTQTQSQILIFIIPIHDDLTPPGNIQLKCNKYPSNYCEAAVGRAPSPLFYSKQLL